MVATLGYMQIGRAQFGRSGFAVEETCLLQAGDKLGIGGTSFLVGHVFAGEPLAKGEAFGGKPYGEPIGQVARHGNAAKAKQDNGGTELHNYPLSKTETKDAEEQSATTSCSRFRDTGWENGALFLRSVVHIDNEHALFQMLGFLVGNANKDVARGYVQVIADSE